MPNLLEEFQVKEELGRGGFGIVNKVQSRVTGQYFVLKSIQTQYMSPQAQQETLREISILKSLEHPHIIKYYDSFLQNKCIYILMEYAEGGDLHSYVKRKKKMRQLIDEEQIWTWTYEICQAVQQLHKMNIIHRDIKGMNIFLTRDKRVKLGDMGLSTVADNLLTDSSSIGTPMFLSPEQIRHQPYGFKVDVWGIGCVLYYLAMQEAPFLGDNMIALGKSIVSQRPVTLNLHYSNKLARFIWFLLEKNQQQRPNITQVLKKIPVWVKTSYQRPTSPIKREGTLQYREESPVAPQVNDSLQIGMPDLLWKRDMRINRFQSFRHKSRPVATNAVSLKTSKSKLILPNISESPTFLPKFKNILFTNRRSRATVLDLYDIK